jgi:hypothetical protein
MSDLALTIKQPWADLIMAGVKDIENRTWPVPSTLPQWRKCNACGERDPKGANGGWPVHLMCLSDGTLVGPFPFRLWIHAGATVDWQAAIALKRDPAIALLIRRACEQDRCGVLLGSVTVTGCHHYDDCPHPTMQDNGAGACSPWAEPGRFHWTLADPQPLATPIPMRGRQRLWRLPADVAVPA